MKKISIVSGCKNEEGNVIELYSRVKTLFETELSAFEFEIIFIDNASTDATVDELRRLCATDKRVKVIVNMRDYGVGKSGLHAWRAASGDALVGMASDLEDPPELIADFVRYWAAGIPVVLAQKVASNESALHFAARQLFYRGLNKISEIPLIEGVTGFGLYDRAVVEEILKVAGESVYFRGLIPELGYDYKLLPLVRKTRTVGISKNSFFSLWDAAMLGVTRHSRLPLRLATLVGGIVALVSLIAAATYFVYKLVFWETFGVGIAPLTIGMFFLGAVQLLFIGVVGEYVGAILSLVEKRAGVLERERINFD